MDNRESFELDMIQFFKNWKYTKGQFHPFDESLSGIDAGINNLLKKYNNSISYELVKIWGETLIYTFKWPDENSTVQINITPRGEKGNVFFRYGINWKPLPNEN
jgi:hypothetical protein